MFGSCSKNFVRVTMLLAFCLVFGLALAAAQSTTSGAVNGVVSDQSGAVVPGAKVDIRNMETNDTVSTTSDDAGRFRAANLQPGSYEIKVNASGFAVYTANRVAI